MAADPARARPRMRPARRRIFSRARMTRPLILVLTASINEILGPLFRPKEFPNEESRSRMLNKRLSGLGDERCAMDLRVRAGENPQNEEHGQDRRCHAHHKDAGRIDQRAQP